MSGKYDLFNRLLAEWSTGPVVISTGRTAEKIRQDYETITGRDGDDVIVIDCITHEQGDKRDDTPTTKYVASAGNLTDIGIKFTDVVESSAGRDRAVGVYSLSQLLMYWDPERIYRFTRVMTSQTSGEGWPFVGVVNSAAHDEQVVNTLHEPFDVVVETRVEGATESSASAAGSGSPPNGPRSRRLVAFSSDYPTSLNLAPSGGPSGIPSRRTGTYRPRAAGTPPDPDRGPPTRSPPLRGRSTRCTRCPRRTSPRLEEARLPRPRATRGCRATLARLALERVGVFAEDRRRLVAGVAEHEPHRLTGRTSRRSPPSPVRTASRRRRR